MKIALVIERMDPARGGRETSTGQIAAALAARGHEVTLLCQDARWEHAGVAVRALGRRGLLRTPRLRHFVQAVQHEAASGAYDVVHATLPIPGANVYQPRSGTMPAQAAASLRRRPWALRWLVRTAMSCRVHRRYLARLEAQLVRQTPCLLLPVSEMVAREFAEYYGRTEGVQVVMNAANVPAVDEQTWSHWRQKARYLMGAGPGSTVFLTVAKNFELKGVAELIRAFARWYHAARNPDAYLVIVGQEHPEGYQRHAGLRDVGSRVVFAGPTAEIERWYAACDACVLLSWYDPCSRVILEALRYGIPCLTTAYNGAAEVLAGGAGVVIASPADAKGIVAGLADLHDASARERRRGACLAAGETLSIDRHVTELLAAYAHAPKLGQGAGHAP
ncbi:MAG: glycosyltransferase family 4 protein [Planctomycetota bacterium]|nr:glycosyltransferase family 4 protein [Planctomycetota bacterium]